MMKLLQLAAGVLTACTAVGALPQPQVASAPPSSSSGPATSPTPSSGGGSGGSPSVPGSVSTVATSISTAVPEPTVAVSSPLFSAAPPQQQPWCAGRPGSRIYCPGEILQTVQLAELYEDSKTFVDKPTIASEDEVVAAFANVTNANTVEALINWIDTYFAGEGLDVLPATIPDFNEDPGFLENVEDPYIKGWIKQVHGYWRDLVRVNVVNESCSECVSSQIPLNRSFVVPGGRFRENYYWDSFFILEGLLTSGLQDLANNTINNYLDLIEDIGFIPNGGRIYYLNRSQPPLFTQMLYLYIKSTNDTSYLERAVRLNDRELQWWDRNNSLTVTGPSGQSHFTHSYTVNNSAPRPESYAEDWQTVNGPIGGPYLNLSTDLYSDLASGAESGYDYSAGRWFTDPELNTDDTTAGLRTIDINEIVPVDLESILYRNYRQIAEMYEMLGNSSRAGYWSDRADKSRAAIIDLHWDSEALAFREYNLTAGALVPRWSIAGYYPYWSGIFPDEVTRSASAAEKAFSGLAYLTAHYNGSIPITLYESGQQWDWPNVWPPTLYITVKAIENIPRNVSQVTSFANYSTSAIDFTYLPSNHFGLEQSDLPGQPVLGQDVNITTVSSFDELGNLGDSSALGWADGLATALVQRYMSSAYCSWYSTGGSIPGLLEQLSQEDLNATNSVGNTGNIFEKFSAFDIDAAGAGGEYEVQAGFGWTNGVAIWFARNYGSTIQSPACPAIEFETARTESAMMAAHRNLGLRPNLVHNYVL